MQARLKIRKSEESSAHRRTRTDYNNIKNMIDSYTQPSTLLDSSKMIGYTSSVYQNRLHSKPTASSKADKNITRTVLATEYKDNSKSKMEKLA